ncbi:MAG: DUF4296 domain-containing protein [Chitinophagaceae bacterium]
MRKLFLIFLIPFLLFSCSNKSEIPKGVLPKKKMQAVMWDMARAGEFLNGYVLHRDTSMDKAAESQKWHTKIYQLHKITEADFDRSYAWYVDHPVLMKELLDSLSRKDPPPARYGQSATALKDSLKKKDSVAKESQRRRLIDTLNRKRIIKKKFKPR